MVSRDNFYRFAYLSVVILSKYFFVLTFVVINLWNLSHLYVSCKGYYNIFFSK